MGMKQALVRLGGALLVVCAAGCTTSLMHVPSAKLDSVRVEQPFKLMVADVGDARGEISSAIGSGVSYWLPISFRAEDESGQLPVSHFVAASLTEDLNKVGYKASLATHGLRRMEPDDAVSAARQAGVDYLVTTRLTDGMTHFWGFLLIPFFEPVWTRIGFDVNLVNMKSSKSEAFHIYRKRTEWRFAKVTVLDAIFDAGIFGPHWHKSAWGRTVVPDALADAVQTISEKAK